MADSNNIQNKTLKKMIINHFETTRKGFFDAVELMGLLQYQCQYLTNSDNPDRAILAILV